MTKNLEILKHFEIESLPDLDVVTLGALELFTETRLPDIDYYKFKKPIALGSVNGFITSQIVLEDSHAVFADEASYMEVLDANPDIDGAFLLSASGGKHAIGLAKELNKRNLPSILITNNPVAPALGILGTENTIVLPKNREPYTYNTSTYMGIMLSKSKENPEFIHSFIDEHVAPIIPKNIAEYKAYTFIVPTHLAHIRSMLRTKFDELFGPHALGRPFTVEEIKHAKTIVTSPSELFISFGEKNNLFGDTEHRLHIPLPENADYAAIMAIGYYVIGQIQKGKPAYFKGRIKEYCREISEIFGHEIKPIVE